MTHKPETVLITGATGDFGKAFCKRFESMGCRLLLWGRSGDKLRALQEELKTETYAVACDMRDMEAIKTAWQSIPEKWNDVDLLINNAGGAHGQEPAYESCAEDWEEMIDVNVKALAVLTNCVLPGMASREKGHIINIGSVAGVYPYPGGHAYCGVKAFVKQFSLSLRADLIGKNVRVTDIEPGMVETRFSLVRFKGDRQKADAVYAGTTPLQAEDVAGCVAWAATLPEHVNINVIEVMPTTQGPGPLAVKRFS